MANKRLRILIRGAVQGVGFRPTVWRYAREAGLAGFVTNDSSGVTVEVEGPTESCQAFAKRLSAEPPPAAVIREFAASEIPARGETEFRIQPSAAGAENFISIPPDLNVCADCLRELADPADRRYRYPFINCTNCGPRFTITKGMPYDRPQTTMSAFPLCPDCAAEYADPADRRFHAQPVACPRCGPRVWLELPGGERSGGEAALSSARQLLADGGILALRGLGGFHLACDATSPRAVALLRERKNRPHKPLAVMCPDLAAAERLVELSEAERHWLTSPFRPIVLAAARPEDSALLESLAPGNSRLGVMLPYTPLHALLFAPEPGTRNPPLDTARGPEPVEGEPGTFQALVMTSGNRRDEPICRSNDEARRELTGIADAWLLHDREIHNRADDSIVMVAAGAERLLRRARGFAPRPVRVARSGGPTILGLGAEMKGAFCLLRGEQAYLSQYLGELDEAGCTEFYREALARFIALLGESPTVVVHDLHPDYFTTRLAKSWPEGIQDGGTPARTLAVQHHHAHALSVLAEMGDAAPTKSLAIILDGTGWGLDGTVWGGELLLLEDRGARFRRVGSLVPFRLAGADRSAREPWRPALALARQAFDGKLPGWLRARFEAAAGGAGQLAAVGRAVDRGFNAPEASSAGRLFDAAAFLVLGRGQVTFEAQAAIELEALAGRCRVPVDPYPMDSRDSDGGPTLLDPARAIRALAEDVEKGRPPEEMAAAFHSGLAKGLAALAGRLAAEAGVRDVLLSGGCFQNRLLLEGLSSELAARGLRWYANREVPANDAGVALGQVLAASLSED